MMAIFLGLMTITAVMQSYIMAGVTALSMIALLGLGHNFLHEKLNWGRFCMEVTGFGHR